MYKKTNCQSWQHVLGGRFKTLYFSCCVSFLHFDSYYNMDVKFKYSLTRFYARPVSASDKREEGSWWERDTILSVGFRIRSSYVVPDCCILLLLQSLDPAWHKPIILSMQAKTYTELGRANTPTAQLYKAIGLHLPTRHTTLRTLRTPMQNFLKHFSLRKLLLKYYETCKRKPTHHDWLVDSSYFMLYTAVMSARWRGYNHKKLL